MSRSFKCSAAVLLGAGITLAFPTAVLAQGNKYDKDTVEDLGSKWTDALVKSKTADTQAERDRWAQEAEGYKGAMDGRMQVVGAKQQIDRVASEIERSNAQAERDRRMYQRPGFWSKVGDTALDVIGHSLKSLVTEWIRSGGMNRDLLNKIKALQEERDKLRNARNFPANGALGMGRLITDSRGLHGYDRDGDGFVDVPVGPDGKLGRYDPTSASAYDEGGLVSGGLGSDGADAGAGFEGFATPDVMEEEASEDEEEPTATAEGFQVPVVPGLASGTAEDVAEEEGSLLGEKADASAREIDTVMGRLLVLPKLDLAAMSGDQKEDDWADWEGASWDDSAAEDGWTEDSAAEEETKADKKDTKGKTKKDTKGKKGKAASPEEGEDSELATDEVPANKSRAAAGEDEEETALVDELIRVETVIAEWRKAEREATTANKNMSGYQADEASTAKESDPFEDVRDEEGRIDLSKVDLWLVGRDTWKDGKEPLRYRITLAEDVEEFEPIHGGVLVVRGEIGELELDQRVLDEIGGEVQTLEVVQVILSAERPAEEVDEEGAGDEAGEGLFGDEGDEGEDEGW